MSVQVSINIANGSAERHLSIELQSEPRYDNDGRRDLDDIGEYAVVLTGGARSRQPIVAEFHHRYREDVLALITAAIAALREEGVEQA